MSLSYSGRGGEIRIGRKVMATLQAWSKGESKKAKGEPGQPRRCRISFQIEKVDEFWANYGPPTTIALALPGQRRVYDIESGDFRAGALIVKLPPRVEHT